MKKILNIFIAVALLLSFCSCEDWLDVNTNPNSPTNLTASVNTRLPWIQYGYNYAYASASANSSPIAGHMVSRNGGSYTAYTAWAPGVGAGHVTPYQQWFTGAASNLNDLVNKARQEEAYHYIGAAYAIHAMGFMLMTDYYGEMPYTEALGTNLSPKHDDGKTIFYGCIDMIDSAIIYFQKAQPLTATPLSKGDSWNGGDVNKWIKMCYGFKARWLNNLSKKSFYDADAVLSAVANGPQSNAEGTIIDHVNDPSDNKGSDLMGVGDPMKTSFAFDVFGWGDWARISKWYLDLLENPRGSGVEDPRVDRLVPSNQHINDLDQSRFFTRTKGVDVINSNIRLKGGPIAYAYNATTKKWTTDTSDPDRKGDTAYVVIRSRCAMQNVTTGEGTYFAGDNPDNIIFSTGTFYTFPESQTDVMTYHEMCFIKAEALFRKGDKPGALQAYKDGVRAHIDLMQIRLNSWGATHVNPYKRPMSQTDIDNFMISSAIAQTTADLTMADIMTQKFIAMSFTLQNWNDVRRFDYSTNGTFGVAYPGLERPMEFVQTASSHVYFPGTAKADPRYWFRRIKQCSLERTYNSANTVALQPLAEEPYIWAVPVWWDTVE